MAKALVWPNYNYFSSPSGSQINGANVERSSKKPNGISGRKNGDSSTEQWVGTKTGSYHGRDENPWGTIIASIANVYVVVVCVILKVA